MKCVPLPIIGRHVFAGLLVALHLVLMPTAGNCALSAAKLNNRIVSIAHDKGGVLITTEQPLGDAYSVYDAIDPLRVILDFTGINVDGLESETQVEEGPVKRIRVSSFQLLSGQMGRVELFLDKPMAFKVLPGATSIRVDFGAPDEGDVVSEDGGFMAGGAFTAPVAPQAAKTIGSLDIKPGMAVFHTDGRIAGVKHFPLADPARLVVDLFGVKAAFEQQVFALDSGFRKLRMGRYPDKTRVVFDASSAKLPNYRVDREGNALVVGWGAEAVLEKPAPEKAKPTPVAGMTGKQPAMVEVKVTGIDFEVFGDKSILRIGLTRPADIAQPLMQGNIIQFGIRRASISQQHRRSIDPSVFPTSVRLITPYTVRKNGVREVRFAVEMKERQKYELRQEKDALLLIIDNGRYSEPLPAGVKQRVSSGAKYDIPDKGQLADASDTALGLPYAGDSGDIPLAVVSDTITVQRDKVYSGKKISLVFDDADIRNILQLIGEVSNLNIIVGDEVKGDMTLRLVDVPWDQALDLVLEIRELGKLQEGNVLRILPVTKIRQMQQEQFAAARAREKLEDLVTDMVPVNYTDVDSLVKSCEKRLSDRGKIIGDVRDKKMIITDIPSVVADIRQLVKMLDTPVRQVLIEARIVEASATFSRDLGVNWGLSYKNNPTSDADGNEASIGMGGTLIGIPISPGEVSSGIVSGLTFGQVGLDKAVLDLRLAALEQSGHGRIISTPRVATLNGQEAEVAQGTEIPYLSTSDEGTKTEFKKAELSLKVTPEINPDGSVILEIEAKNDSRGANTGLAEAPAIDTKRATTKVLVKDGETTVIGGIFIQDKSESDSGVPWLMNVPILGHLFKSRSVSEERRELLVFITPRILD